MGGGRIPGVQSRRGELQASWFGRLWGMCSRFRGQVHRAPRRVEGVPEMARKILSSSPAEPGDDPRWAKKKGRGNLAPALPFSP